MEEEKLNENSENEKNSEKQKPKGVKRIITFAVLAVIAVACGKVVYNNMQYESTDDAYVETTTVTIAPKVSGEILEVYITDNQPVKAGDKIAKIDPIDYQIKLDEASANYNRKILDQQNAKANFAASQSNIEVAKKDLDRYTKLFAQGAVSKQTLDAAQAKYDAAKANLTNAEQNILSGNSAKVADADLKALKAKQDKAQKDLDYTIIKAPQSGTIASRKVEKGMYVNVGSPLCVIVPNNVWVVANYKENQLRHMKPGQPVEIKIDAYPDHVFKGKIDSIQRSSGAKSSMFPPENAVGSFVKIVQRIPVKIVFTEDIDTEKYNIVPGMSVIPKVKVK